MSEESTEILQSIRTSIATMQVGILNISNQLTFINQQLIEHGTRIRKIEDEVLVAKTIVQTVPFMAKFGWALAGLIIPVLGYLVFLKGWVK